MSNKYREFGVPVIHTVMFTKNSRPAFYILLAIQLGFLVQAFLEELGVSTLTTVGITERLGNWVHVITTAWFVLFLIAIAAMVKKGGLPKSEAVLGLVVLALVGVIFVYLS